MVPVSWYLVVAALLFVIGLSGVIFRRNIIVVLMSIELILNSVNINFVAFSHYHGNMVGHMFTIFTIAVAAAEVAVALGILIALVKNRQVYNVDEIDTMKG